MTTKNLRGLDALVAANKVVADSARARGRKLEADGRAEQASHEQEMADHAIARRALIQQHSDVMRELDEEAGQVAYVLNGDDSDDNSSDEPEPEPASAPQPPTCTDHDDDNGGNTHVNNPPVPPDPAPPRNNRDPRTWRGIAWLLALVGAFIGLIVARFTYDPMWHAVKGASYGWFVVLVILWFVALILAGFFTGGWIGANREEVRERNEDN